MFKRLVFVLCLAVNVVSILEDSESTKIPISNVATKEELAILERQAYGAFRNDSNVIFVDSFADFENLILSSANNGQNKTLYIRESGEACSDEPHPLSLENEADVEAVRAAFGEDLSSISNVEDFETLAQKHHCVKVFGKAETYLDSLSLPVSGCLDSVDGDGGSVAKEFGITVSAGISGSASIANASMIPISFSAGISVSGEATFSVTSSCDVTTGNYVQMYSQVFYTEADIQYRSYYRSNVRKRKTHVSEWSEPCHVTYAAKIAPHTTCIGGVTMGICRAIPVEGQTFSKSKTQIKD
ncbi:hypothetical protein PACTADRAFT_15859 [Pachysolen tannophilus NRRL Y-2460]|uniref:Uncharacterized protein n=1 Tax=Pachysolen tannophilus NRRL Y-2460 TaxID=669874 RepID=A0A1E4U074_PACTA|nr:hypothetical protein PACTADRAFT_15859 [Pachysolen tannophilus NRRL Y-2460]